MKTDDQILEDYIVDTFGIDKENITLWLKKYISKSYCFQKHLLAYRINELRNEIRILFNDLTIVKFVKRMFNVKTKK